MKHADLSRLVLAGWPGGQLAGCAPDPIKEAPATGARQHPPNRGRRRSPRRHGAAVRCVETCCVNPLSDPRSILAKRTRLLPVGPLRGRNRSFSDAQAHAAY